MRCGRAHHVSAVDVPDRLMAEAHAEHRDAGRSERRDRLADDPRLLGPARAGRQQHRVGFERERLVDGEGVVAEHDRIGPELTQVLDEVVDEAVVRIDHEHARHAGQPTVPVCAPCDVFV